MKCHVCDGGTKAAIPDRPFQNLVVLQCGPCGKGLRRDAVMTPWKRCFRADLSMQRTMVR